MLPTSLMSFLLQKRHKAVNGNIWGVEFCIKYIVRAEFCIKNIVRVEFCIKNIVRVEIMCQNFFFFFRKRFLNLNLLRFFPSWCLMKRRCSVMRSKVLNLLFILQDFSLFKCFVFDNECNIFVHKCVVVQPCWQNYSAASIYFVLSPNFILFVSQEILSFSQKISSVSGKILCSETSFNYTCTIRLFWNYGHID